MRQTRPTRERYTEIQNALIRAGYLEGPADGAWGESSAKALSKFQLENGLESTGRIDALSLIKLDLGPKYENQTAAVGSAADSDPAN